MDDLQDFGEDFFDKIIKSVSKIKTKEDLYQNLTGINSAVMECLEKKIGMPTAGVFIMQTYFNAWHDCKTDDPELIAAAWVNQLHGIKIDARGYIKRKKEAEAH